MGGKWGDVLTDVQLKTGNCHQKQQCLEEGWTESEGEGSVTRSISSAIKASGSDEERFALQTILEMSLMSA